jgi:uncharacterized membrane protein
VVVLVAAVGVMVVVGMAMAVGLVVAVVLVLVRVGVEHTHLGDDPPPKTLCMANIRIILTFADCIYAPVS